MSGVSQGRPGWRNTTHDWSTLVDEEHLRTIAERPDVHAPGGVQHLVLEVLAYAADEAAALGGGHCTVIAHADGSWEVRDYGRGTDTRRDEAGQVVRKPVMATKDLRYFDRPSAQLLPDGHPRRGMSVVAALSEWLVHSNYRSTGAWQQRYEHGLPTGPLVPITPDGTTGTSVWFKPQRGLAPLVEAGQAHDHLGGWPHLHVETVWNKRR